MDYTTYVIGPYAMTHTLCDAEIEAVGSMFDPLTLSKAMQAATRHNASCPAIRRV